MHAFAWLLNDLFFERRLLGRLPDRGGRCSSSSPAIAGLIAYRAVQAGAPPTPEMAIEEGKRIRQTLESGHHAGSQGAAVADPGEPGT